MISREFFNLFNGFLILIMSFVLGKFEKIKSLKINIFVGGGIVIVISSALLIFYDYREGIAVILGICGLSLGSTSFLLSSHQLSLANVDAQHASAVRSSMALYLTLIFGLSEIVSAYLLTYNYWFGLILFRTIMIICSIILFSLDYWRKGSEV